MATEGYKNLISRVAPFLKERGFSKRADCFQFERAGNWGVIDFQKSRKSNAGEVIFTINLGVCSGSLLEFFRPGVLVQKPKIEDCHWRERVGFFLPEKTDKWWRISDRVLSDNFIHEIVSCLGACVIPEIISHISDENLCAEWMQGKSPGLTKIQRLINLSVLLKKLNKGEDLTNVIREMEVLSAGASTELLVKGHIRNLESI
ncbi:DUF4304 domain-containing protein [Burkholderia ambifaria]|uniref:DUF4304 domain-containing protein n=1 Tax=Burkholderia ambifaria TaxID=152480 RepID=UPI00158F58B6|nr:DUF4304 domain-containing protein [Burkholderia ambifaria]